MLLPMLAFCVHSFFVCWSIVAFNQCVAFRSTLGRLQVPEGAALRALDDCAARFRIYPIWLCAVRMPADRAHRGRLLKFDAPTPWYVDVGIYGRPPCGVGAVAEGMRWLAGYVRGVRGFLWSYSLSFCTPAEMWATYDRDAHDRLRRALRGGDRFVDLYTKIGGAEALAYLQRASPAAAAVTQI